jgi:hypothetical protein
MNVQAVLDWLESLTVSQSITDIPWAFPVIESCHVIAITLVVGSIIIVDLRLLGITSNRQPVTALASEILPWTWGLFLLAVLSGGLMFFSNAHTYFYNTAFRLKMACMLVAGLNMLAFHLFTYKSVHAWNSDVPTVRSAKVAGAVSLLFWVGVVFFGRRIGFTIHN